MGFCGGLSNQGDLIRNHNLISCTDGYLDISQRVATAYHCNQRFLPMSRVKFAATLMFLSVLLFFPYTAQSDATNASHCQALYNEVWELRAKGKDGEANGLHGRVRHYGCFEPPVSESLCSVLQEQEIRRESEGNTGLAGVIRAQQRRFACA